MQSLLSPPATNIQPLPEYKSSVAEKPRWVLSHYGVAKTVWDMVVLLATIYVAIVVPYNAAFHSPEAEETECRGDVASDIHVVGGNTIVRAHHNRGRRYSGNLSDSYYDDPDEDRDEVQEVAKKGSIVMDVIVEGIFIIGKERAAQTRRETNRKNGCILWEGRMKIAKNGPDFSFSERCLAFTEPPCSSVCGCDVLRVNLIPIPFSWPPLPPNWSVTRTLLDQGCIFTAEIG